MNRFERLLFPIFIILVTLNLPVLFVFAAGGAPPVGKTGGFNSDIIDSDHPEPFSSGDGDNQMGQFHFKFKGDPAEIGRKMGQMFYSDIISGLISLVKYDGLFRSLLMVVEDYSSEDDYLEKFKGIFNGVSDDDFTRNAPISDPITLARLFYLRYRTIIAQDPSFPRYLTGISQTTGIPVYVLVVMNLYKEYLEGIAVSEGEDNGCSSWVAAGNATADHHVHLHKNRDFSLDPQIVIRVDESGKYAYTALVTKDNPLGVSAGINEYGLAVANNLVSTTDVVLSGIGNLKMNRLILESCKNVEEVFDLIDSKDLNSGAIFFVADKEKAAVIEVKAHERSTEEESIVRNGVIYRTNHYIFLGGSGSTPTKTSLRRYNAEKEFFSERNVNLTVLDDFELSRHHYLEDNKPVSNFDRPDGSISNYHTLFGVTFDINPDYPEVLSTMWVAMAHPCSSIYVPIHLGASEIDGFWTSESAYNYAMDIFYNNLGPWAGPTPHFLEFESKSVCAERLMAADAALLLNEGNHSGAIALIDEFDKQYAQLTADEMKKFAENKFWYDGFATMEGIQSLESLRLDDMKITLDYNTESGSEYVTLGALYSVPVTSTDWRDAVLYADFDAPANTSVKFKILTADKEIIADISAEQIRSGYNLSSLGVSEIVLYAELSTTNKSISPTLLEWRIIGLEGERDLGNSTSIFSSYYFISAVILGTIFISILLLCYRRKRRKEAAIAYGE